MKPVYSSPQNGRCLITSLLVLFLCTCGRAQLRPDAPALTFLADQMTDLGLAWSIPNGDFGPTQLAWSRQNQLWRPGGIKASWKGNHPWHTGIGAFTPQDNNYVRYNKIAKVTCAAGERQQAFSLALRPSRYNSLSANFSYFRDDRFRDANDDGRNDLSPRRNIHTDISGSWNAGDYSGSTCLQYFQENGQRQGRLDQDLQKIGLNQHNALRHYGLEYFLNVSLNAEHVDRSFSNRTHQHRRLTSCLQLGIRPDHYNSGGISWQGSIDLLHREDRLQLPGINREEREQFIAASGEFSYDLSPFRFRYNQQLRASRTDSLTYRPNAQIVWHTRLADLYLTGIVNRGGGYRNPLLSDGHLAFSLREYQLGELRSEDFWRRGFSLQAKPAEHFELDAQAFYFTYDRYTAVRYTDANELRINQVSGTTRRLLAAQASYVLPLELTGRDDHPAVYFNYRYDELRPENAAGMLLPARHAAWVRLEVPLMIGYSDRQWANTFSLSYLRQSGVQGLKNDATPLPARDRLDASLKTKYKDYWLALSGEQLLHRESRSAYGFDPLGEGENIPLGSEFSTILGSRFTVSIGVEIGSP